MPHFKSRVIARGLSPSLNQFCVMEIPLDDHAPLDWLSWLHFSHSGWSLSRDMKRCLVSRDFGVAPSTLHRGLISWVGSRSRPHLSH